jgi:hypothetical protein
LVKKNRILVIFLKNVTIKMRAIRPGNFCGGFFILFFIFLFLIVN